MLFFHIIRKQICFVQFFQGAYIRRSLEYFLFVGRGGGGGGWEPLLYITHYLCKRDPETHSPKSKGHNERCNLLTDVSAQRERLWCWSVKIKCPFFESRVVHKTLCCTNLLVHRVWLHALFLPVVNLHFSILHLCNVSNREQWQYSYLW